MTRGNWFLAAVPIVLVVGCGSSGSKGSAPSAAPVSVETVTVTPSPSPSLDTQGTIFCKLIDKAQATSALATGADLDAYEDAIKKLNPAARASTNQAVHRFITDQGAVLLDNQLGPARSVCESQGWVGTP